MTLRRLFSPLFTLMSLDLVECVSRANARNKKPPAMRVGDKNYIKKASFALRCRCSSQSVNTDLKLSEITGLKMYFFTGLNAVLYVVPCNPSCDMIYQKF